jgi:hypothetical protein
MKYFILTFLALTGFQYIDACSYQPKDWCNSVEIAKECRVRTLNLNPNSSIFLLLLLLLRDSLYCLKFFPGFQAVRPIRMEQK